MATTPQMQSRIKASARELAQEMGEVDANDALSGLDAIETQAVEIADAITVELMKQLATDRPVQPNESLCPQCGQSGRYQGPQERSLLTRRGPATIAEPKYYCPCCRKDFFPSNALDWR